MPKKKKERNRSTSPEPRPMLNRYLQRTKGVCKTITCKLEPAGAVFLTTVGIVHKAADAFPPLKSAAGLVVCLTDDAKRAKKTKSDALALLDHVEKVRAALGQDISDSSSVPMRYRAQMVEDLCTRRIQPNAMCLAKATFRSRFFHLPDNEGLILRLNRELDETWQDYYHFASTAEILEHQFSELSQEVVEFRQEADVRAARVISAMEKQMEWMRTLSSAGVALSIVFF